MANLNSTLNPFCIYTKPIPYKIFSHVLLLAGWLKGLNSIGYLIASKEDNTLDVSKEDIKLDASKQDI